MYDMFRILQTRDGQDFFVAQLINNETFNFIVEHLQVDKELIQRKADPQKVLTLVADRPNGKEFTTDYPVCPMCKSRQNYYDDHVRTSTRELHFATWNDFERLTEKEKVEQIRKAVQAIA